MVANENFLFKQCWILMNKHKCRRFNFITYFSLLSILYKRYHINYGDQLNRKDNKKKSRWEHPNIYNNSEQSER